MEELYIRLVGGQPVDHPILGENFRQAFPHLDTDNLPANYARFERVPHPDNLGPYQIAEVTYGWVDGVVKDIWNVRDLDAVERAEKLREFQNNHEIKLRMVKERIVYEITIAPDEYSKQQWLAYQKVINEWVPEHIEAPVLPESPKKNSKGFVVDLTASGSAPNVIG